MRPPAGRRAAQRWQRSLGLKLVLLFVLLAVAMSFDLLRRRMQRAVGERLAQVVRRWSATIWTAWPHDDRQRRRASGGRRL
ncbi:MAG: hypothetical protein U5L74_05000 [Ideonella sp.]|nr:hypothetical protein [Ideonella sp.]